MRYSSQLWQRDNHFVFVFVSHIHFDVVTICACTYVFCAGFNNWQRELSLNFETAVPFWMVITVNTCMELQKAVRGFLVFRNGQDLNFYLESLISFLNIPLTVREKFIFLIDTNFFLRFQKWLGQQKQSYWVSFFKSLYFFNLYLFLKESHVCLCISLLVFFSIILFILQSFFGHLFVSWSLLIFLILFFPFSNFSALLT